MLAQLLRFRELGSEYLNVEFGWKPFVRDLRQMYDLTKTIDERLAKIRRENGKSIRRKATLEHSQTLDRYGPQGSSTPWWGSLGTPLVTGLPSGRVRTVLDVQVRKTTDVWFSAGYRYWIPDVDSFAWDLRARAALFGALPTPELLWQITPWSWLIDWFANVGDVLSNASDNAVDNLTTRYSFTMMHTVEEWTYSSEVNLEPSYNLDGSTRNPGCSTHLKTVWRIESKCRIGGGNPFGLDVQLKDLSPYQLSILAALGLSRGLVR